MRRPSKFIPRIIGMAKLQRQTKTVVRDLDRYGGEYILSVREKPAAVIMGLDRYEALRTLEEMKHHEEDEILDIVAQGNQEYAARKTVKAASLSQLLG
ncbi:hypothetical protein HZA86_04775 [Candidatus Uhrbacteria bacterium]|nr:hypothetical protein [Candidatus Uhrbacteria bacterium]